MALCRALVEERYPSGEAVAGLLVRHTGIARVDFTAEVDDVDAVDEIELSTGYDLLSLIGTVGELTEAVARAYRGRRPQCWRSARRAY